MSTDTIQRFRPCTLTVTPLLAVLMLFTAGCSEQQSSAPEQTQTTEPSAMQESTPAAETGDTVAAAGAGEAVYKKACKNCHEAGVANAPKLGDSEAWTPRIAKGKDALFETVKNGLNAMPPKGGCMTCSDEELRSAVEYFVSQGS